MQQPGLSMNRPTIYPSLLVLSGGRNCYLKLGSQRFKETSYADQTSNVGLRPLCYA